AVPEDVAVLPDVVRGRVSRARSGAALADRPRQRGRRRRVSGGSLRGAAPPYTSGRSQSYSASAARSFVASAPNVITSPLFTRSTSPLSRTIPFTRVPLLDPASLM